MQLRKMYLLPFLDIDIHFMENYGNFVFIVV